VTEEAGIKRGPGRPPGSPNKAYRPLPPDGIKPLAVLLRWIKFYDDRAVGIMDKLQTLVPTPEAEPLGDVPAAAVVRDLEAKLKTAVDAATDYAAKAAGYIHPRLKSTEHSSKIDFTRLTEDELTIFLPLLRKCLLGSVDQVGDVERSGSIGGGGEIPAGTQH
jgi:hypothetical protein